MEKQAFIDDFKYLTVTTTQNVRRVFLKGGKLLN